MSESETGRYAQERAATQAGGIGDGKNPRQVQVDTRVAEENKKQIEKTVAGETDDGTEKVLNIGDATILHHDCIEGMRGLRVDAVITDPPCGLGVEYNKFKDTESNARQLAYAWFPAARMVARNICFMPGLEINNFYPKPDHVAVLNTEPTGYKTPWGFCMWRPILCYGVDPNPDMADVLKAPMEFDPADTLRHPGPTPMAVAVNLVDRYSKEGETVLDPLMGSGTIGVAAILAGRKFIGIESDRAYFDQAAEWIKTATRSRAA